MSDFGLSTVVKENGTQIVSKCGSDLYMPPEMYLKQPYALKMDIWYEV